MFGRFVASALVTMFGLSTFTASAKDPQTIGELHPPVEASMGEQKITVFFLKNNLKNQVTEVHVPYAEIFYAPANTAKPTLNYVWKVESEQIASVFFFERKSPGKVGKSMYVLMKSKESTSGFEGVAYWTMELPLIKRGDQLSLAFFSGDPPDPVLQYCRDGRDLENETDVVCPYKDTASIKKRLASLDEKAVEGHKP